MSPAPSGGTGSAHLPAPLRVALYGLSEFEQHALASFMRLAGEPFGHCVLVGTLADADFIVADGDRPAAVAAIAAAQRTGDTVFIGHRAPPAAAGRHARPIDARQLLRALDQLAERRRTAAAQLPVDALIVDDSAIARRYLQKRLCSLGVGALLAADSNEALQCLAERSFGHIFIDLELGEQSVLDGLGLCQHIRRSHRQSDARVPVLVMVSAHHGETDRVRATLAGFDHCLAKPLADAPLRNLIKPARCVPRSHSPGR